MITEYVLLLANFFQFDKLLYRAGSCLCSLFSNRNRTQYLDVGKDEVIKHCIVVIFENNEKNRCRFLFIGKSDTIC
jgi:hypothetical protein